MVWILLACSGGGTPTPAPVLAEASTRVTFGTVAELGAHVLEASLRQETTTGDAAPEVTASTFRLRWRDEDHWSAERTVNGVRADRMVVWDGAGWTSNGEARWRKEADAEPLRVQLAHTWDPWEVATELFPDRITYTEAGGEEVEGRRVRAYTLSLGPAPAKSRRVWEPTALAGSVWVDEGTAVRLLVDLTGEAVSGRQKRVIELKLAVHGIGMDPGITPPDAP